jgi:hypothetical protein
MNLKSLGSEDYLIVLKVGIAEVQFEPVVFVSTLIIKRDRGLVSGDESH